MSVTDKDSDARSRLDGLLQGLVEKSEESLTEDGAKNAHELSAATSMPPPSTPTKRSSSGKTPRKRRKKDTTDYEYGPDGTRHQSFVLKLFDRSVDFAKFPEDASLYTLSRAWMKNKPHEPIHRFRDSEIQDGSTDQDETTDVSSQVHKLPQPIPIPSGLPHPGIPLPLPQPDDRLDMNQESEPNISDLKRAHIQRWKKVSKSWKEQSLVNQKRYLSSIVKIRKMFKH